MSVEDSSARSDGRAHLSRRGFIRATGAATGAATVGVGADQLGYSPVGTSQAIAPVILAGGVVVTGATGYAVGRKIEDYLTGDDVEGLEDYVGPDALRDEAYLRARSMEGADDTVLTTMKNRIEDSKNVAWSKAKAAAIEAINNGDSESDVTDAAKAEVDDYYAVLQENYLNHWTEQINKLVNIVETYESHSEVDYATEHSSTISTWNETEGYQEIDTTDGESVEYEDVTLVDGRTIESVPNINHQNGYGGNYWYNIQPEEWDDSDTGSECQIRIFDSDGNHVTFLRIPPAEEQEGDTQPIHKFNELWPQIEEKHTEMSNNITAWVQDAYSEFQEGEIDIDDMMDPVTWASEYAASEDSSVSYAAADLLAMGVDADLGSEYRIHLQETDAEIEGILLARELGSMGVGEVIDPANHSDAIYFSYDPAIGEGTISTDEYEEGIDGGEVIFTSEPYDDSIYQIETIEEEIAEVERADFSEEERDLNDDGTQTTVWVADVSDQLEETVVNIEEVRVYAAEGSEPEIVELDEPFEILSITDAETGEERDASSFESYNHQTSDVTLTEEELQQLLDARDGMDQYETGGGGGGFLDDLGNAGIGVLVAVAVAIGLITRD